MEWKSFREGEVSHRRAMLIAGSEWALLFFCRIWNCVCLHVQIGQFSDSCPGKHHFLEISDLHEKFGQLDTQMYVLAFAQGSLKFQYF